MAVDPKQGGDWLKHPVTTTGEAVPPPPIPFPETVQRPTTTIFGEKRDTPEAARRKAWIGRLAAALFIMANTGLAIKHHVDYNLPNTPASVTEDVRSIPEEWGQLIRGVSSVIQKEPLVPITYDNRADNQIAKVGVNMQPIKEEELPKLFQNAVKPLEKDSFSHMSMLFPVRLKDNEQVQVSTIYAPRLNPFTLKVERLADGKELTIPRKGSEIIMPALVDRAEVFQISPYQRSPDSPKYFVGLIVKFIGPDGIPYYLIIKSPDDDLRQLQPTDIVKNAPIVGKKGNYITALKDMEDAKGMDLPVGTPILKTDRDNAKADFLLIAVRNEFPPNIITYFDFAVTQETSEKSQALFLPQNTPTP